MLQILLRLLMFLANSGRGGLMQKPHMANRALAAIADCKFRGEVAGSSGFSARRRRRRRREGTVAGWWRATAAGRGSPGH